METQGKSTTAQDEQFNQSANALVETTPISNEEVALTAENQELIEPNLPAEQIVSLANQLDSKNKSELIEHLATIIQDHTVSQLRQEIEAIKIVFYKLHNTELEQQKAQFYAEHPEDVVFIPLEDKFEVRLKELLALYRTKRDQYVAASEAEKEANYKAKLSIIELLKELSSSSETLHNTFEAFRELQNRWKEIGLVPQPLVRDLWETYNHHIEIFYNYIKINKELRDLDLKRNHEAKVVLCEQAEALHLESSAVNAFHKLQRLHEQWSQIGPVSIEFKEVLWERFKNASTLINKRHQEHFDTIRDSQLSNLTIKEGLCEQIEQLSAGEYANKAEWDQASENVIEIQKIWKTVGFAPKKDNNKIYERFRAACDKFFGCKREFFDGLKDKLNDNYQTKLDLCVQAEVLCDNTQWKQTTEEILALQKRWKETGATSRKHSEIVWNRFRAACDKFFDAKSKHFENNDIQYAKNLEDKLALLNELEKVEVSGITFEALKEYQRRWSAIGFVPIKQKETLGSQYKKLIDGLFDSLRGSESSRRVNQFKHKVDNFRDSGRTSTERDKLVGRHRMLESEIQTLENNIGFFGKSKGAEAMIKEVQNKINKAKQDIVEIIEKVKIIDNN